MIEYLETRVLSNHRAVTLYLTRGFLFLLLLDLIALVHPVEGHESALHQLLELFVLLPLTDSHKLRQLKLLVRHDLADETFRWPLNMATATPSRNVGI